VLTKIFDLLALYCSARGHFFLFASLPSTNTLKKAMLAVEPEGLEHKQILLKQNILI
jgi:hypothetical protein